MNNLRINGIHILLIKLFLISFLISWGTSIPTIQLKYLQQAYLGETTSGCDVATIGTSMTPDGKFVWYTGNTGCGSMMKQLGLTSQQTPNEFTNFLDIWVLLYDIDNNKIICGTYYGTNDYDWVTDIVAGNDGSAYISANTYGGWLHSTGPINGTFDITKNNAYYARFDQTCRVIAESPVSKQVSALSITLDNKQTQGVYTTGMVFGSAPIEASGQDCTNAKDGYYELIYIDKFLGGLGIDGLLDVQCYDYREGSYVNSIAWDAKNNNIGISGIAAELNRPVSGESYPCEQSPFVTKVNPDDLDTITEQSFCLYGHARSAYLDIDQQTTLVHLTGLTYEFRFPTGDSPCFDSGNSPSGYYVVVDSKTRIQYVDCDESVIPTAIDVDSQSFVYIGSNVTRPTFFDPEIEQDPYTTGKIASLKIISGAMDQYQFLIFTNTYLMGVTNNQITSISGSMNRKMVNLGAFTSKNDMYLYGNPMSGAAYTGNTIGGIVSRFALDLIVHPEITSGVTTKLITTKALTTRAVSTGITTRAMTTGVTTGITTKAMTTGVTTGITTGVTSRAMTTGVTTGLTTGVTSRAMTTGVTTGITTGVTTGITTGVTSRAMTTGVTTGLTTGVTSRAMTTGVTTGITSGFTSRAMTTGVTTGITSGVTTNSGTTGISTARAVSTGITSGVTSRSMSTGITSGVTSRAVSTGLTTRVVSTGVTSQAVSTGITTKSISTATPFVPVTSGLTTQAPEPYVNVTVEVPTNGTYHECTYCYTNHYVCSNETEWNNGTIQLTDPRSPNYEISAVKIDFIRMKWCTEFNRTIIIYIEGVEVAKIQKQGSGSECTCDETCDQETSNTVFYHDWSNVPSIDKLQVFSPNYICLTSLSINFELAYKPPLAITTIAEAEIFGPSGSKDEKDDNWWKILAIAVASLLGCVMCGMLAAFLVRRKKKKKKKEATGDTLELNSVYSPTPLISLANHPSSRSSNVVIPDSQKYLINVKEVVLEQELGHGAFGTVYQGKWRSTPVAVKMIKSDLNLTDQQVDDFMREAAVMMSLKNHTNVVNFLGICQAPLCLVTELLENGSLDSYLQRPITIDFAFQLRTIKGIAAGMQHLQMENLIHKDLAARNILLSRELVPKVSDFGLSRLHEGTAETIYSKTDTGPLKWMAPESLNKKQYSVKSDVWSFGITCIEIITRNQPYPDLDLMEFTRKYVEGGLDPMSYIAGYDIHPNLRFIIQSCFTEDPAYRPDFVHIVSSLEMIH